MEGFMERTFHRRNTRVTRCRAHAQQVPRRAVRSLPHPKSIGSSRVDPRLGDFRSRVAGVGPQIGFFFPVADRDGYLNLRAYSEFDAKNRLEGWTAYVTFSVEAAERKPGEQRLARPVTLPR